jgi:benzylsuccinate CoA-transferase BbsF subunit
LLAALEHRRRTGEGQYIDFSQSEAGTAFLTPAILDYTVNGRIMGRNGNADDTMSPHGVYPAKGDDRWIAIACANDEQWKSLAGLIGCPERSALTLAARVSQRDELDQVVATWTSSREIAEIEATLVAAGVPVHGAQNSPECWADPQLHARHHFVTLEHQVCGPIVVEGSRMRLSRTPARIERAAPALGQDTYEVLTEVFGMSDERVGDLFAREILE